MSADTAVALTTGYLDRPLGIGDLRPLLSWQVSSDRRGARQSAYRILVASDPALLADGTGDLWDSGRVESSTSLGIPYSGTPPTSRQRCWWTVRIWDESGTPSPPSEPTWWEMGLLSPADWTADWLNVEDPESQLDREHGLPWVAIPDFTGTGLTLTSTFDLAVGATGGRLTAVVPGWAQPNWTVWIDDVECPSPSDEYFLDWAAVGALSAGTHRIRLEAVVKRSVFAPDATIPEIAVFLRLHLADGKSLRIGTDTTWAATDADAKSFPIAAGTSALESWPGMPAMHLRRDVEVAREVSSARLYATALGVYEARLNGERVGDARLAPEASDYSQHVMHQSYDVSDLVRTGANTLGLTVADGWYAAFDGRYTWGPPPRRVIAQLEIDYTDGGREVIGTGPGWRIAESHIQRSAPRRGEVQDHRLEQQDWDRPGFDDSAWWPAVVGEVPTPAVVPQSGPPIRVIGTVAVRSIADARPGVLLVDFGRVFAGWCRLTTSGPAGTTVELRYAEMLDDAGNLDPRGMGNPEAGGHPPARLTLRGDPAGETFEEQFTYRSFRYIEISGLESTLSPGDIVGVVASSANRETGQWRSGSDLLDRIWDASVETFRSNLVSVPTDCPSREQRGWSADAAIAWDAGAFAFDIAAFSSRHMGHILAQQTPGGLFPGIAPSPSGSGYTREETGFSAAWSCAGALWPWMTWRRYGDREIVDRSWDAMERFVAWVLSHNPDHVWRNKRGAIDWGDWLAPMDDNPLYDENPVPRTPGVLVGTAYLALVTTGMTRMAEATGRTDAAARYRDLFESIRNAFIGEFVRPDGTIGTGSQGAYALALRIGLVPDDLRAAAHEHLAADVRAHGHLTTGIVATKYLLDALADGGDVELVYDLLLNTTYPSWGYMVENGGTTIWEEWAGDMPYNGGRIPMSQNHPAFGSVADFLMRRIAGIDSDGVAFGEVVVGPLFDDRLARGGGTYDSVRGTISTDWAWRDGGFSLDVTIPANTSARIHLPAGADGGIRESGRDLADHPDVSVLAATAEETVVAVGSGRYAFSAQPR